MNHILMSFIHTRVLTEVPLPVNTVEGLKWGQYVGSPALGAPAVGFTQTLNTSVQTLVCLKNDNVFVLSHSSTLLTVHQAKPGETEERLLWSAALSWGYMDGGVRVCTSPESAPICLMEHHTPDKVKKNSETSSFYRTNKMLQAPSHCVGTPPIPLPKLTSFHEPLFSLNQHGG